jgi:hypothetical protein
VIRSRGWDNGAATNAGAVAWGSGTSGVAGRINALNSAIGFSSGFGAVIAIAQDNVNGTILFSIGGRVLVGSQTVGFTAVRAGSTAWDAAFTELVDPVLDLGYVVPPDAAPLPWTNLNRLSVTFTNALEKAGGGTLTADDFDLRGVNQADYSALVTGFSYDAATRTATFTFSQPLQADTITVHLEGSDVQDAAGHLQLGQYDFRFDVLPGDYTRNGVVDAADYVVWRKQQGTTGALPFATADSNGDAMVDDADYGVWRANFGNALPTAEESAPISMAARANDSMPTNSSTFDNALSIAVVETTRAVLVECGRRSVGLRLIEPGSVAETPHDTALLAWLVARANGQSASISYDSRPREEKLDEWHRPSSAAIDESYSELKFAAW